MFTIFRFTPCWFLSLFFSPKDFRDGRILLLIDPLFPPLSRIFLIFSVFFSYNRFSSSNLYIVSVKLGRRRVTYLLLLSVKRVSCKSADSEISFLSVFIGMLLFYFFFMATKYSKGSDLGLIPSSSFPYLFRVKSL